MACDNSGVLGRVWDEREMCLIFLFLIFDFVVGRGRRYIYLGF